MKFSVYTDDFKKALEKANKVTGSKPEMLKNVQIRKIGRNVHLLATNLNQFVDTVIESDTVGDVEFQFSDTKAILKAMKFFTDFKIKFDCEGHGVTISCGGKKAQQKLFPNDFPDFPTVDGVIHNEFEYSSKKIKKRFDLIKYAASTDKSKNALTGICFKGHDMVAIDGYRIALSRDDDLTIATSFISPLIALKVIPEIMNEDIKITTNGKFMKVVDENTTFLTRLIDEKFIDYSQFLKYGVGENITIDVKKFENSLKYLNTFKDSKKKGSIHWRSNRLGTRNDMGCFESEIDVDGNMGIEISFNGDFMLDALGQFSKKAIVEITTDKAPMLIRSENDCNYNNIALVLPTIMKGSDPRMFDDIVE